MGLVKKKATARSKVEAAEMTITLDDLADFADARADSAEFDDADTTPEALETEADFDDLDSAFNDGFVQGTSKNEGEDEGMTFLMPFFDDECMQA